MITANRKLGNKITGGRRINYFFRQIFSIEPKDDMMVEKNHFPKLKAMEIGLDSLLNYTSSNSNSD